MKKLLCVLLALVVVLALAACGEQEKKSSGITTEDTVPEAPIFTITILHSDGEETTSRMTSEKEYLVEALVDRTIMTEDMLTIGGEKADPALNAYWTLFIDGVYATQSWEEIVIEPGAVYMFEYTVDMEHIDTPTDDEQVPEEEVVEEPVEEVVEDTTEQ